MRPKKTAIVAGATGLIGGHLVLKLLEEEQFEKVYALVRKPTGNTHAKLTELSFDYTNSNAYSSLPKSDVLFCCLGTTIKRAGSQEKFKQVDYEFPLQLGKWCKENGVSEYHIVTALGADANSRIFYNKTKGEVESALKNLTLPTLHIYQPSLLLGKRKETRLGELFGKAIMKLASPLMVGSLEQYKGIEGSTVAQAMVNQSNKSLSGTKTYLSNEITTLANVPA